MKTTMVTAEILLTEWKGASGTDAYFYEGMLY